MCKKKQDNVTGPEQAGQKDQQRPNNKRRSGLFFIVLLILVAGAGLFYFYQRALLQQKQVDQSLQSKLGVLQDSLTQLEYGLDQQQQQFVSLQSESNALRQTIERIEQKPADLDLDLALAEAEHLLTIAIQRLELDQNVAIALAAIKAADKRLLGTSTPGIIGIRKQFAEDINALRAVNTVDTAGLALYLADMINRIDQLHLKPSVLLPDPEEQQFSEQDATDPRPISELIWQELKDMVIIKQKDEVTKILPDEQYYIYRYLRLELASARLAVLQSDTANMQESVRMILAWFDRYFDQSGSAITNLITALRRMRSLELTPALPDINSSLEAVRVLQRQGRPEVAPDQVVDAQ